MPLPDSTRVWLMEMKAIRAKEKDLDDCAQPDAPAKGSLDRFYTHLGFTPQDEEDQNFIRLRITKRCEEAVNRMSRICELIQENTI